MSNDKDLRRDLWNNTHVTGAAFVCNMARKTLEIFPRVLCNFRFPCLEHETNDVLEAALVHHYISSCLQLPAFCLVGVYP